MFDLFDQFIHERQALGRAPATIKKYQLHVGHFLAWQHRMNADLSRRSLVAYLNHLRETKSNNTTANYFADVCAFLTWLVDTDTIPTNPAARLKPKRRVRRMPSYTKSNITLMLHGASVRDTAIIVALLDTGLRSAELCSLQRADVDWATGHFLVVGKGDKQRASWFSPYTIAAIKRYLAERRDINAALWVSERGASLTHIGLRSLIRRRLEAVGIRQSVTRLLHSFRSTFAKNYLKQGGDTITLAALMGHSTLEMTKRYAELNDEELGQKKAAINPLAAFIDDAARHESTKVGTTS